MGEFRPKVDSLGRMIGHVHDMYSKLHDAMTALRCAEVGDTRYALTTAHEIEKLLERIDGKDVGHE